MVGASLLADPGVERLLDRPAVVVGKPAMYGKKILGFLQAPAPPCGGGVGIPGGEGCLMSGAQPGLVLFTDVEVQVDECVCGGSGRQFRARSYRPRTSGPIPEASTLPSPPCRKH